MLSLSSAVARQDALNPAKHRNTTAVLGCLAEKLAGTVHNYPLDIFILEPIDIGRLLACFELLRSVCSSTCKEFTLTFTDVLTLYKRVKLFGGNFTVCC